MKISEAIERADRLCKNEYSYEDKINWLKAVDKLLKRELIDRCEGGKEVDVEYTFDDLDKELIAPGPYDELYVTWLLLKIHFYNGEIELYNNMAEQYNNQLYEFRAWYLRNHRGKALPKIQIY